MAKRGTTVNTRSGGQPAETRFHPCATGEVTR